MLEDLDLTTAATQQVVVAVEQAVLAALLVILQVELAVVG
jgi:hypothetical protein